LRIPGAVLAFQVFKDSVTALASFGENLMKSENQELKKQHGGAREGSGRKKKDRSGQELFESAEAYLFAVVQGRTEPDAVRVQAAKTLIAYETAKKRAPVASPPPAKLRQQTKKAIEQSIQTAFEKQAAEVRRKFSEREDKQ
jgi:hypothetical protein